MKSNKLRILSLAIVAILAQGTCAYAASSSEDTYTKEELEKLTPGWNEDIKKSNYKVNSYTNTFSSAQTSEDDTEDSTTTTTTTDSTTTDSTTSIANTIVSTAPSTGNKGDFWGKTSNGKWILIEQGVPATGWRMVRGSWYYMDADGIMQTGWINDGQTWYYLQANGAMAYNTYVEGYYLNWNGALV